MSEGIREECSVLLSELEMRNPEEISQKEGMKARKREREKGRGRGRGRGRNAIHRSKEIL